MTTRWLDDEEQATWRAWLAATRRLDDALDRQLRRDSGMPHSYYEVLVRLSEADGRRLRMGELAEAVGASRSRTSHAVARLEDLGWVARRPCPDDRRGQDAVLTEAGHAALVDAAPGHVATVRALLFDALSPRQATELRRLCTAVLAGIAEAEASTETTQARA